MTYEGMRRTIRLAQPRIRDAARAIIEAEDLRIAGHPVRVPRYAGYSVWVCSAAIHQYEYGLT